MEKVTVVSISFIMSANMSCRNRLLELLEPIRKLSKEDRVEIYYKPGIEIRDETLLKNKKLR